MKNVSVWDFLVSCSPKIKPRHLGENDEVGERKVVCRELFCFEFEIEKAPLSGFRAGLGAGNRQSTFSKLVSQLILARNW